MWTFSVSSLKKTARHIAAIQTEGFIWLYCYFEKRKARIY
jgi:hypothetical protein